MLAFGLVGPNAPVAKYEFADFFAGDAAISTGMRLLGFNGCTFDLRTDLNHNLMVPVGFLAALVTCMSIKRGGLVWFAPPMLNMGMDEQTFNRENKFGRRRCEQCECSSTELFSTEAGPPFDPFDKARGLLHN